MDSLSFAPSDDVCFTLFLSKAEPLLLPHEGSKQSGNTVTQPRQEVLLSSASQQLPRQASHTSGSLGAVSLSHSRNGRSSDPVWSTINTSCSQRFGQACTRPSVPTPALPAGQDHAFIFSLAQQARASPVAPQTPAGSPVSHLCVPLQPITESCSTNFRQFQDLGAGRTREANCSHTKGGGGQPERTFATRVLGPTPRWDAARWAARDEGSSAEPGPTYLGVGVQGVGQLTGPVTGRRVPQDRVKRFGRCSPRASGQRHGQQQQRREPQLGLDPKLPLWRRHLVPLCHSGSACCCFLFRVSPSSGPAPFPAPPAGASASESSSAPPRPAQATENLSWAGLRTRPTISAPGAERRPPPSTWEAD